LNIFKASLSAVFCSEPKMRRRLGASLIVEVALLEEYAQGK